MNENIYEALVEQAAKLADVEIPNEVDQHHPDRTATVLEHLQPVLNAVRKLDLRNCVVPVEYNLSFFESHYDHLTSFKTLACALHFDSDACASNHDVVARNEVLLLDLANAIRRGGLVVSHLISLAISGMAINRMRSIRSQLNQHLRQDLIAALARFESEREPFEEIAERDAKWEAESGYEQLTDAESELDLPIVPDCDIPPDEQRELLALIVEQSNRPAHEIHAMHVAQDRHTLALTRMLAVDLGLRCWEQEFGRLPDSLDQLTPRVCPTVPKDPFTNKGFIYVPLQQTFQLYSTGPDQTDHGGNFGHWAVVSKGGYDLCLDSGDLWPDACFLSQRPGFLRRLWDKLNFWE